MLPCTVSMQQCSSLHCSCNSFGFEDFDYFDNYYPPRYSIRQVVLHKLRVHQGEILHPVVVYGLLWTGIDWVYLVQLSSTHPWFVYEDRECLELEEHFIEALI